MKLIKYFLLYMATLSVSCFGVDRESTYELPQEPLSSSQEIRPEGLANPDPLESKKPLSLDSLIANQPDGKLVFNLKDLSQAQFEVLMNTDAPCSILDKFYREPNIKRIRVLSADGGGTRGIMEALVLQKLEELSGRRIYDLFDVFAGTSTAVFIILAAYLPKPGGINKFYSMSDVVQFYRNEAPVIFSDHYYWSSGDGLAGTQYGDKPLLGVMQKYFKEEVTLADMASSEKLVIITGYDLDQHTPIVFSSDEAVKNKNCPITNPSIYNLIRAAISAPTYFDPITITNKDTAVSLRCGDGGLANNNPTLVAIFCACIKFRCSFYDLANILSLGTGYTLPKSTETYTNYGLNKWGPILSKIFFNGQSQQFLADLFFRALGNEEIFKRIQYIIPDLIYDLAKCTPENFDALTDVAQSYIKANPELFVTLSEQLAG